MKVLLWHLLLLLFLLFLWFRSQTTIIHNVDFEKYVVLFRINELFKLLAKICFSKFSKSTFVRTSVILLQSTLVQFSKCITSIRSYSMLGRRCKNIMTDLGQSIPDIVKRKLKHFNQQLLNQTEWEVKQTMA